MDAAMELAEKLFQGVAVLSVGLYALWIVRKVREARHESRFTIRPSQVAGWGRR